VFANSARHQGGRGLYLARCIAKDDAPKYFAVVDLLFKQQGNGW